VYGYPGPNGAGKTTRSGPSWLASAMRRPPQAVRVDCWRDPGSGDGYLAVLVGPTFYARVLSAAYALGAGSDSSRLSLRWVVLAPALPIAYLLVLRAVPTGIDKFGVVLLWHVLRGEQTSGD
jgi:hypothetical protein